MSDEHEIDDPDEIIEDDTTSDDDHWGAVLGDGLPDDPTDE